MLKAGDAVFLCALALLTLGVVMVSSAGMSITPVPVTESPSVSAQQARTDTQIQSWDTADAADGETTETAQGVTLTSILTGKSVIYMGLAVAAMFIASFLPMDRFADAVTRSALGRHPRAILLTLTLLLVGVLALVYVPGLRRVVNGSSRWISLPVPGLESFQPSEIAKWVLPVALAVYAVSLGDGMRRFFTGLLPALVALGLVSGMIVLEDLGTGALVACVGTVVLIGAGARVWQLLMLTPPAFALLGAAIITSPYRVERVMTFLNPYADPQGAGYHMIQSMATVAGGGIFGRGLGHGLQKFGYLPEDTTDFLFAVICEELGLAGAALVIFLYVLMGFALYSVLRSTRRPMLQLVTLGVLATILGQAMINLIVVTGLGPTKGIALPLLSSGGTGWIATCASLGVVIAIARCAEIRAESGTHPVGSRGRDDLDSPSLTHSIA